MQLYSKQLFLSITVILQTCIEIVLTANCKRISACVCQLDSGGLIDLSSLSKSSSPAFDHIKADASTYYYDPCKNFKLTESHGNCTNCALCLEDSGVYECLGTVESSEFTPDIVNSGVAILYKIVRPDVISISHIHLQCSNQEKSNLLPSPATANQTRYDLTLMSHCACADGCRLHRGLSTGSILLIIAACFTSLYINVGYVYNRFCQGAQGRYALPHYEFWADLPGLIKDGYWFFISPCVGDSIEYRYYQRL